jgi:hypothetical protein
MKRSDQQSGQNKMNPHSNSNPSSILSSQSSIDSISSQTSPPPQQQSSNSSFPSTGGSGSGSSSSDYVTLTKFNEFSRGSKSGYMSFQKLNTLLPRWKRKYFVLNGNYLRRYRSEDSINHENENEEYPYKEFILSSTSTIQHTDMKNCFILKGNSVDCGGGGGGGGEIIEWILKTDTEEEAKEWIVHISSHIHSLFLQNRPDLLDIHASLSLSTASPASTSRSFWTLPTSNVAGPVTNPVGIRSLPDQHGPRTGEGIYPGEIFEIVQQISMPTSNGITYLALADDRGWVFDKHPTGGYDLIVQLQPQEYKYLEKITTVMVNADQVQDPSLSLPPPDVHFPLMTISSLLSSHTDLPSSNLHQSFTLLSRHFLNCQTWRRMFGLRILYNSSNSSVSALSLLWCHTQL